MIEWILLIILIIFLRVKIRGFFWKARNGDQLSLKQFFKRWGEGVTGLTPLQQTKTSLMGFPLIFGGTLTGIVIMILRKEWWLVAILSGSLPLVSMQLVSLIQKYKTQKKIYQVMKELENE